MNDEKLDALLEAVAENTTTLIDVQKQAAATSASAKDSRAYVQTIAKNTSWDANSRKIAQTLTKALEQDHTALNAAAHAAKKMQNLSIELTHKVNRAAETQQDASNTLHSASEALLSAIKAHQQGRWRRVGIMALIGALCGSTGFFLREPASRFTHVWEAGAALQENPFGLDCQNLQGVSFTDKNTGRSGCVVWEVSE